MPHPTPELDPALLIVAAHELGHAVVAIALGITVLSIEVDRRAYTGMTQIDFHDDTCTAEQLRGALIGSLAGFEAERRWCQRHGGQALRRCSRVDFRNFARNCRRVDLSEAVARSHARATLARHWAQIERLAPELARHGHVVPWQ